MKVLQINSVVSYGSTGKISRDIADVLKKNGYESYIAYGRGDSVKGYNLIKMGNKFDNYLHFLKSYLFNKHGEGSIKETKKLIEKIEEIKPDIIQLHNIHGYFLNYKILFDYLNQTNINVVWLLHDQWAFSPGPAYFDFEDDYKESIKKLQKRDNDYPKSIFRFNFNNNLLKKKKSFTSLKNMKIVTPSKWLGDISKKTFLGKYDIITINNGIDTRLFSPKQNTKRLDYKIKDNEVILLAVSNYWEERKGIKFLKELSFMLSEGFRLVVIGQQMEDSKFDKRTILINRTNDVNDLIQWYSAADIFINPTLFENFPTVNLEAISSGAPIITYDTGGSKETLPKNSIGYVVPKNNEELFIKKIYELTDFLKNKNKKDIIEIQREKIKIFDKEIMYQKYIELYNDIMKVKK